MRNVRVMFIAVFLVIALAVPIAVWGQQGPPGEPPGTGKNLVGRVEALEADVSQLQTDVGQIQTDLNTETAARQADDNNLQTQINNEITARQQEDNNLQTQLNDEMAVREAEDNTLQAQIDDLNANAVTDYTRVAFCGTPPCPQVSLPPGAIDVVDATCPGGRRVLGGGGALIHCFTSPCLVVIGSSEPLDDFTWRVVFLNVDPAQTEEYTRRAHAICATFPK